MSDRARAPHADHAPDEAPAPVRRHAGRRISLLVLLAFSTTALGLLALPSATLAWGANSYSSASERELQALTNQARASAGRRSLVWDSALASIARWRSKDMIQRGYFSHDIPGGGKVFDVMTARGYCYRIAGENIGWNNYPDDVATAQIQAMFMASSGHRSNILGTAWDHIGIGAYKAADGRKMWTVLFADRCGGTASKPKPKPKPAAKPKPKPATAARATPRPTRRPTAVPTARPTSTPAPTPEPTDLLAPRDMTGPGSGDGTGHADSIGVGDADGTGISSDPGLRVVDRPALGGLIETVVDGVAWFLFGG